MIIRSIEMETPGAPHVMEDSEVTLLGRSRVCLGLPTLVFTDETGGAPSSSAAAAAVAVAATPDAVAAVATASSTTTVGTE